MKKLTEDKKDEIWNKVKDVLKQQRSGKLQIPIAKTDNSETGNETTTQDKKLV